MMIGVKLDSYRDKDVKPDIVDSLTDLSLVETASVDAI